MSCMVCSMHRVCMSSRIYLGHVRKAAMIVLRLLHAQGAASVSEHAHVTAFCKPRARRPTGRALWR